MKVFITGHRGYIGSELIKRGFLPLECDVTNPLEIEKAIKYAKPQLVLHLAAKSGVNWCQKKENREEVISTNLRGTWNVFYSLSQIRIPGVFLSTDQIWKGGLLEPHKENSKRTPPVNDYALSKLSAESVVSSTFNMNVIRASYLFNYERLKPHLRDMEIGLPVKYPVFIRRSFMHLSDFCDALEQYCDNFYQMPKVLHLAGSETVSWFTFMREAARKYGYKGVVLPRFREVESGAPRPWFGGLNTHLAQNLGFPRRDYIDGIARMKNEQ